MYIAFEGIEGSGKSVQIKHIEEFLKKLNYTVFITREPGSTPVGAEIRKILLNSKFSDISTLSEIFLYFADRAEHFDKIIKKQIDKVDFIISDRSLYSTIAYQGYARNFNIDFLTTLNDYSTDKIYPDYVFLFDCPVEVGLKRALKRDEKKEIDESRFEKESITFHENVRQGYLTLAKQNKWIIIDASKNEENVRKQVIEAFKKILN